MATGDGKSWIESRTGPRHLLFLALVPVGVVLFALGMALGISLLQGSLEGNEARFHGTDVTAENLGAAFVLSDAAGKRVSIDDYLGKAVILTFGYTHCPDACPTTLARLAKARKLLGEEGARLQVLFITVDPKRDTAEFLGRYVRAFDPSFVGLWGVDGSIRPIAKAYHADYRVIEADGDVLVDHTVDAYLIDPVGHTRVALHYTESAAEIADDVRTAIDTVGFCSPWLRWVTSKAAIR